MGFNRSSNAGAQDRQENFPAISFSAGSPASPWEFKKALHPGQVTRAAGTGHSMRMNRWLWLVGVVASGCLVPVDVRDCAESPLSCDAGVDAGQEEVDAGVCRLSSLVKAGSLPGERVTVPLPGCSAATVVIRDGQGNVVATGNGQFDFVPDAGGVYTVVVSEDGGLQEGVIVVDEVLTGGIERTYVDRIDTCHALTATSLGTLLCERVAGVTAYFPDGGVLPLPGTTQPRVVADELWLLTDAGIVRHYTDTGSELRFDAETSSPFVQPRWGWTASPIGRAQPWWGEAATSNGATTRRRLIVAGDTGFADVRFDGTSLSTTNYVNWTGFRSFVDVDVDGRVYSLEGSMCRFEQGCATTLCPAITTCASADQEWVGIDEEVAWVRTETTLGFRTRPFARDMTVYGARLLPQAFGVMSNQVAGSLAFFPSGDVFAPIPVDSPLYIPRRIDGQVQFQIVMGARSATRDWALVVASPTVVRFVPR